MEVFLCPKAEKQFKKEQTPKERAQGQELGLA
jgi:hypothetical protein